MIRAYMNVDLKNPLAKKYSLHAGRSFKCVSDVFRIHVRQCITPETIFLDALKEGDRSPQERAALNSQYVYAKRMSMGERIFYMEHDAYLRPEHEQRFRDILKNFKKFDTCLPGIAMECYSLSPRVASDFCHRLEEGQVTRAAMGAIHQSGDRKGRFHLWPKKGMTNESGIARSVTKAHTEPKRTYVAPITQLVDRKQGSTVTDRPGANTIYTEKSHPNFHFIDID